MLKILKNKNFICIYFNNSLLFRQIIFAKDLLFFSDYTYTLFYVFKILIRFGLVKPLKK